MGVREATDPEIIELGQWIGFKGKILIDDSRARLEAESLYPLTFERI